MNELKVLNDMIKFENNFIQKNYRSITSTPDIALTELIANSWDAGALKVSINIPLQEYETISIEDNGTGMSDLEFRDRWMTLNYDRQIHQGNKVIFPDQSIKTTRIAFGRNGVGRHAMFCFSDKYFVETTKDGNKNIYEICLFTGEKPYYIKSHKIEKCDGHGTKIYAEVCKNLPDIEKTKEIISARYLYDPNFKLIVNGDEVELSKYINILDQKNVQLKNGIKLELITIDSSKSAKKSQQHGIAFWVGNRLVGSPSWTYNDHNYLDGRVKAAKRFTIVVKTDDLLNNIHSDWSGFYYSSEKVLDVMEYLQEYVNEVLKKFMSEIIDDTQKTTIESIKDDVESLPISGQRVVSSFIQEMTQSQPLISTDFLISAAKAITNIEKARTGKQLLQILSNMETEDIDKLTKLLQGWDVEDIVSVIDEIDKRLLTIEAISKIQCDSKTDELHTLHPLVLSSRWLFGSEYDSPMYSSNETLNTIIKKHFKETDLDKISETNLRKRPDIVIFNNSCISINCTDRLDEHSELFKPDQILILELKRGGLKIGQDEVNQAQNYVRQIKKCSDVHSKSDIKAYVVGCTIADISGRYATEDGIVFATTYSTIVENASKKLFSLRTKLKTHYDSLGDKSLIEKALSNPKQIKIVMPKK